MDWHTDIPEEEITAVPQNREAEEATIGAVFINPDVYHDIAQFLKADDFYIHRHKWIWGAFGALQEKRTPIDLLTIADYLDERDQLKEIGGPAYLTSLVNQVPSSLNADHYARIVEDRAIRRRAIQAANELAKAAYSAETIEAVQEAASAASSKVYRESDDDNALSRGLSKVYDRAGRNAELTEQGKPLEVGVTVGFTDLDKILLGIESEESVLIAGRPGDGKTSFLLNAASHMSLRLGKQIAFFSQEMSDEEIARRLVSSYSEIDSQRIKAGALKEHEWSLFTNAIDHLDNALYVSDTTSLTPAKLRAKCLKLKQTRGLDAVFIDYIQLMSAGIKTENRTREVGYISRQIKMLTRELHCPIFSACQLSRASEQRAEGRPVLADLRDAGDLEQDANTVIFLYRPDKYGKDGKQNIVETIVAKRRDGAVGTAELIYRPSITKFVNATTRVFNVNEREYS